jgi:TRAP-type uncharacterized transport system fused permease subunit
MFEASERLVVTILTGDKFWLIAIFVVVLAVQVFAKYPKSFVGAGGEEVYRCSLGAIMFLVAVALAAATFPLWFPAQGESFDLGVIVLSWLSGLCCAAAAIYVAMYRITLGTEALIFGGVWRRAIPYREISEVDTFMGGSSLFLMIKRRDGRKTSISTYYADLRALKQSLEIKINQSRSP